MKNQKPIQFHNYQQDPRNGEVRIIKPATKQAKITKLTKAERQAQLRMLKVIQQEEWL